MGKFLTSIAAVGLGVCAHINAASAATFSATSYSETGHSLWIAGGLGGGYGSDFHFDPAGVFTTNGVDEANLSGRIVSENRPQGGFILNFDYNDDFGRYTPAYKRELGAKSEPLDNYFLNLAGGTLVGFGDELEGLVLSVTRRPELSTSTARYATQVGTGSNAKDKDDYGLANWFYIDVDEFACLICTDATGGLFESVLDNQRGDINIDLAPVPLPAGGLLMISAMAGFGAMRKFRKAT